MQVPLAQTIGGEQPRPYSVNAPTVYPNFGDHLQKSSFKQPTVFDVHVAVFWVPRVVRAREGNAALVNKRSDLSLPPSGVQKGGDVLVDALILRAGSVGRHAISEWAREKAYLAPQLFP